MGGPIVAGAFLMALTSGHFDPNATDFMCAVLSTISLTSIGGYTWVDVCTAGRMGPRGA